MIRRTALVITVAGFASLGINATAATDSAKTTAAAAPQTPPFAPAAGDVTKMSDADIKAIAEYAPVLR